MKKNFLIVCVAMMLAGCASAKPDKTVLENYNAMTKVLPVPEEQAPLIAQKELKDRYVDNLYMTDQPFLQQNLEGISGRDNFWFVSFMEKKRSTIPIVYMVVIEKSSGKIKFSKSYPPGKEWIIDAALNGHIIK